MYVRSMLVSGKGLACWHPEPRKPYAGKRGVVPGDVGIYSACGGFEKIFNLWEDERWMEYASGQTYAPPKMDIVIQEGEFSLGHIVAQGASSATDYTSDGQ
jgi:hypothetical protein